MEDRNYLILPVSELKKVDFEQILETSVEHLRYTKDLKKTFIKWIGDQPDFVSKLKNTDGPYTHEEMLEIVKDEEWDAPANDAK
jgi:hypothetical protein